MAASSRSLTRPSLHLGAALKPHTIAQHPVPVPSRVPLGIDDPARIHPLEPRELAALAHRLFEARVAAPRFVSMDLNVLAKRSGLDPYQRQALRLAMNPRLPIVLVSGSAGSGKTRVLAAIVEAAKARHQGVLVTAFTGKAAANAHHALRQTGAPTVPWGTLHAMGFADVPPDPALADLVIIDEASFLSAELFQGVLNALGHEARLILIGDDHQLPPVGGSGQPFLDAIRMGLPHARLRQAHRHHDQPGLHALASALRARAPYPPGWGDGVHLTADVARNLLRPVVGKWLEGRAAGSVPQCLAWRHTDCDLLNRVIQHHAGTKRGSPVFEYRTARGPVGVYLGDRVLVTRNQRGLVAYNGLVGTLLRVAPKGPFPTELLFVRDELTGQEVPVFGPFEDTVRLGYCLTVHKAQGSAWDRVIVYVSEPLSNLPDPSLWHYTAVTRARQRLDIVTQMTAEGYWQDATRRGDAQHRRAQTLLFNTLRAELFGAYLAAA